MTVLLLLAALQTDEELEGLNALKRAAERWDEKALDVALSPDATLTLKLTRAGPDGGILSAKVDYRGAGEVKAALIELYKDYDPRTRFDAELLKDREAMLMGEVSVATADGARKELPLLLHARFDEARKVRHLTVSAVDVRATPPPAK